MRFLYDNAPVHTSEIALSATLDYEFQQINHPLYSPCMAFSDYYLFGYLKQKHYGQRFKNDYGLQDVLTNFKEKIRDYFLKDLLDN